VSGGVKWTMTALAIAPRGCELLSGATDGMVTLIDLTWTETVAKHLPAECQGRRRDPTARLKLSQRGAVTSVAFSPNGRHAVSGSQDWTATIWRVTADGLAQLKTFRGHHGRVQAVVFPALDFFLSGSADGSVRMWDVAMVDDGEFSVGSSVDNGRLSPPSSSVVLPSAASVTSVGISPDGHSAYAGAVLPNEVRILQSDGTSPPKLIVSPPYTGRLPTVFDRLASRALTGSVSGLAVWDLSAASKPLRTYRVDPAVATFSGSAVAWVSESDWRVFVVDPGSPNADAPPRLLGTLQDAPVDNREPLYAMAASRDGRWIAIGTQSRRIVIFDTASADAAPVRFESLHDDRVTSLAFDPNGRILASGSRDGTIVLCDLHGAVVGRMRGHTDEVTALAFSPDGELLMSSAKGADGLLLWHVDSRLVVHTFDDQRDVRSVVIDEHGDRAASASIDGVVRLWTLPALDANDLLAAVRARRWVRDLTPTERTEFGLSPMLDYLFSGGVRK